MFEIFFVLVVLFAILFILGKVYKIQIYKNSKQRWLTAGVLFIVGVILDSLAPLTGYASFPKDSQLGIIIGVLPLEEYLLILLIPYTVLTAYKLLERKHRK